MKHILLVVGTRPNFVKIAPIIKACEKINLTYTLIHTGQHYDREMSDLFFSDLEIKKPDITLNTKTFSPTRQITKIMEKMEIILYKIKPCCCLVVGDVSSSLAAAIVVSNIPSIKLAHVESGERSYDKTMPEEINRILIDHISDYLFCSNKLAQNNLKKENLKGIVTGNVMVDSLLGIDIKPKVLNNKYALLTLHRQSNVDNKVTLESILKAISYISTKTDVVFPIHPRTKKMIKKFCFEKYLDTVILKKPLGYKEMLSYIKGAETVLTDSGGTQVETSVLDIPCITLRNNTEHIETIKKGTNFLIGTETNKIVETFFGVSKGSSYFRKHTKNLYWDGKASQRVIKYLISNS